MPVALSKDLLVDLGGWSLLREGKEIFEGGCVKSTEWDEKTLQGLVKVGDTKFHPRLNLRSSVFATNKCNCMTGRKGQVCAHAIALCLQEMEPKKEPEPEVIPEPIIQSVDEKPVQLLKSLVISEEKGIPLRFKVFLPPNLETSAPKDRIMVKVEVEEANGNSYTPEKINRGNAFNLTLPHLSVAALIEKWCNGKLFGMLQLDRKKLTQLLSALKGEDVVFWINNPKQPIGWLGALLPGVHPHLDEDEEEIEEEEPPPRPIKKQFVPTPSRSFRKEESSTENPFTSTAIEVDGSPNYLAIKLPPRSSADYHQLHTMVQNSGFRLEPKNRKWWLRDRHKALNFLADNYEDLKELHHANFTTNFEKQLPNLTLAKVQTEVNPIGNQFELTVSLDTEDAGQLQTEIARGRQYWESGDKLTIISTKTLEKFETLQKKLHGDLDKPLTATSSVRLKPWQLADAEDLLDEVVHNFEAPDTWKQRSEALKNLSALQQAPVGETLSGTLRIYQQIGTAWLYHLFNHDLAGILADEMGLGKTLQALGLMEAVLKAEGGQSLVICPAGLVGNWAREASRFAPNLKVSTHHGQGRDKSHDALKDADVIITSYNTLTRDIDWLRQQEFTLAIADEAQHIKNRKTQNARSLRSLHAKGRFLLTGTPIENSIQDLQSLFDFLMPGYLTPTPKGINNEERAWYHQRMRQKAAPYILRRTKKQVAPELPEKIEQVIYCDMGKEQKGFYEKTQTRCENEIYQLEMSGAKDGRLKMAAFTQLLRLRQVCADPRILEKDFSDNHSAKLQAFREILQQALDGEHRILVFSQFVSVLTLLKQELEKQKLPYCYIDGKVKDRLKEADRFNDNDDIPVFLISLKAGGTGLNLTGADTVVHFDPWWNPAAEAQATDRAHRIGQTKVVTSIKLIVSGSVEEKVLELQKSKTDLLKGLFEESEAANQSLSMDELKALMK